MTVRDALKEQFKRDLTKIPKYVTNRKGLKLYFDVTRGCYVGKDEKGEVWLEGIQHTKVPIFWIYCPNEIEKNGSPAICNTPHLAPIFDEGHMIKCTNCGGDIKIKFKVPKSSACHGLLEELRNESGA